MRARKKLLWPIALTPPAIGTVCRKPLARVWAAIESGELIAFAPSPNRTLCLVEDVVAWVRTWPRVTHRHRRKRYAKKSPV
jgi:hypothetical protein